MADFDTALKWTNGSPDIYMTASYGHYRSGADMIYSVGISISAVTGNHYFGYPIKADIYVNGESSPRFTTTLKNASPSRWTSALTYNTGNFVVSGKTSGTTALKIRLYSSSGASRDASWDFSMTVDPAYFTNTPSLKYVSATETSATFEWSTSEVCNWIRYHLDGSSEWVDVFSGNATSGQFTINGLNANSTHNVYAECRRVDSELWSNSNTSSFSTYDYPYCTNSPDFIIGNIVTLHFYNPLGRNINVAILSNSDIELATGSTSSTSLSGFNSEIQIDNYYNSIKNAQNGNYKVKVVYGSSIKTRTNGNKYSIKGTEKPIVNDITSEYTANLTELTNNNQVVINGVSTIVFKITKEAVPQNNSTISKYNVKWGTISADIININNSVNLVGGTGNIITITVYDSRGLNNTITKTISELVNYVNPTAIVSTRRNNGIEKNTYITISGKLFYNKFGADGIANKIKEIKYWVNTSQTWSGDGYTLPLTDVQYSNPNGSLQDYLLENIAIHANGSNGGFNVGTRYYIKVRVTDADGQISYIETIANVTDGKIAEDLYQDDDGNYHQGINGLADPNYTSIIHGNLNVDSKICLNGVPILEYEVIESFE